MHETLNSHNTESVWRKPLLRTVQRIAMAQLPALLLTGLCESRLYGYRIKAIDLLVLSHRKITPIGRLPRGLMT